MTEPTATIDAPAAVTPAPGRTVPPLIDYLCGLVDAKGEPRDRGTLAALRRGADGEPANRSGIYRYVERWIAKDASDARVEASYLVASLFAVHPDDWREDGEKPARWQDRSFGASLGRVRLREGTTDEDAGVARRFLQLLNTRPTDLAPRLRALVLLLRSRGSDPVPINYAQLLYDLEHWGDDDRPVQQRWAAGFWRGTAGTSRGGDDGDETTSDDNEEGNDE